MAITEPASGSDSASIGTTARLDGDEWVLNGEKIFVTAGGRCDAVVVWATVDKGKGKAAIKSFVVPKGTPGMEVVKLEHKLGIRASDTATILFTQLPHPEGQHPRQRPTSQEGDKRARVRQGDADLRQHAARRWRRWRSAAAAPRST